TVDNAEPILRDTVDNAEPILRDTVDNAEPILRDTVDNAEPILRDTVDNAEPILRDTVDNAEPILRDTVDNAEPILRDTVDNAEPILRGLLLTQTYPAKHPLTSLGSWQRQPWPRRRSSPQAREGHRDTSECEDRSPDFFGLGIWPLLYLFGYVSTKEPVAQKVARITVLLLSLKTFEQR
ncbi:unnamed protein product, partial [Penicillium salamii]